MSQSHLESENKTKKREFNRVAFNSSVLFPTALANESPVSGLSGDSSTDRWAMFNFILFGRFQRRTAGKSLGTAHGQAHLSPWWRETSGRAGETATEHHSPEGRGEGFFGLVYDLWAALSAGVVSAGRCVCCLLVELKFWQSCSKYGKRESRLLWVDPISCHLTEVKV